MLERQAEKQVLAERLAEVEPGQLQLGQVGRQAELQLAWQLAWAITRSKFCPLNICVPYLGHHDDEEVTFLDRVVLQRLVVIFEHLSVGDQFLRISLHLVFFFYLLFGLSDL